MIAPLLNMNSKATDKVFFSGKEEDFVYFSEQFEARMYVLKLNKILDGTVGYREYIPTLRGQPSEEQNDAADRKGKEIFDEKQMAICYELAQCLDRKSVLFLRPYRGKDLKLGACCVRGLKLLRGRVYKNLYLIP